MKIRTTLIAGATVLAFAAVLFAQAKTEPARMPMAWGKVVSLDKAAKTLTISGKMKREDEAKDLVFAITDETKVMVAGQANPGTLDDVKADKRVAVIYKAGEGDAKPVALSIRIMADTGGAPK